MAASRDHHRAVDRAAGARRRGPAPDQAVGRRRWEQRRGRGGDGATAGTLRRRSDLEACPPHSWGGGAPIAIAGAFNGSIEPIARWKVEGSWWDRPVVREYWKVLLNSTVLCELYHDLASKEWFV